ncbi:hypothetical protein Bbelb_387670 [Branchiostoma belcheri]|nr:hypothetical protein Bbelb_387670 [Branchiostoma belcheri]
MSTWSRGTEPLETVWHPGYTIQAEKNKRENLLDRIHAFSARDTAREPRTTFRDSHNLIPDRSAISPACPSAGAPSHLSQPRHRVKCTECHVTWFCMDSPQCGFVTRQTTTRAALRMSRSGHHTDRGRRSVWTTIGTDGLLLKESSEGLPNMYVERSFHLGMRSNVCRVLQPPAPRGITASQCPQASDRVEPVKNDQNTSLVTENDRNTFISDRERSEHVPWQQRRNRTHSLATENDCS